MLKLKTGIMTFKDLLAQYAFAEIRQPFMRLWQTNEPKLAALLDLDKWEKIYQKVQALEPIPSDYYIGIVSRWEHCSPMIDMNCSVYSKTNGQLYGPVACHPPDGHACCAGETNENETHRTHIDRIVFGHSLVYRHFP